MLYRLEKQLMNVNHVGLLIFKLSDFMGIKQKKSTKNKVFYLSFIPIIFKNLMKIPMRLKLVYIHKNKV